MYIVFNLRIAKKKSIWHYFLGGISQKFYDKEKEGIKANMLPFSKGYSIRRRKCI